MTDVSLPLDTLLSSLLTYMFVLFPSLIIEDSVGDGGESSRRGHGEGGA